MKLTDWLSENGFGYTTNNGVITLTGEWISPYDTDVFMDNATVEAVENDNPSELYGIYKITDADGARRVEVYKGGGANGMICDWDEWADANDPEAA